MSDARKGSVRFPQSVEHLFGTMVREAMGARNDANETKETRLRDALNCLGKRLLQENIALKAELDERKETEQPYAPDINAPTERVLSPAPDGRVDWKTIGELLDLE